MKRILTVTLLLLIVSVLAGCKPVQPRAAAPAAESTAAKPAAGLANPASTHCVDNGGKLEILTDAGGGQYGMCTFPDGSQCEEWAYFRGQCEPGQQKPQANMANPASQYCVDQGGKSAIRKDAAGGEVGYCTFSDGSDCEEWAYFRGECVPGNATPQANMPNPASAYCDQNGGNLEIRKDASGGEYGMCVFSDGSECEEWAFMRGECKPGQATPSANMANPASVYCGQHGGKTEIVTDAQSGGQVGMCTFSDGSQCEEWAYFRGQCKPGEGTPAANMANPASVYCVQNGGQSQIVKNTDGSEGGQCVFSDGSSCDEWAYFRGECKPGQGK